MPRLLSPAGLWALASLALPLLLHLWRPPPRTVLLGSLRFLQSGTRKLRNLRWRERMLLLVRMALLAALAVLLAAPSWVSAPGAGPRRWILISPDAAPAGDSLQRLRSLQSLGYETRALAAGFPLAGAARIGATPTPCRDVWSLLREADATLATGSQIAVFSPGRLTDLHAARPALSRTRVEWVATPDASGDGPADWIAGLSHDANDPAGAMWLTLGHGTATATQYRSGPLMPRAAEGLLPFPGSAASGVTLEVAAGTSLATRLAGPGKAVGPWMNPTSLPPLTVSILHDMERAEDARYVGAAVTAAASADHRAVRLRSSLVTASSAREFPQADWTFWLSAQTVPETLAQELQARGANLLSDAGPASATPCASWIVAPSDAIGAAAIAEPVRLWKRVESTPGSDIGIAQWTDANGNPLLTFHPGGRGGRWRFLSRFHPDWTDLPRTSALPALMHALLMSAQDPSLGADESTWDRRTADPAQCLPSAVQASDPFMGASPPAAANSHDLHDWFWVFAATLFAIERFLSRRGQARAPGTSDTIFGIETPGRRAAELASTSQ